MTRPMRWTLGVPALIALLATRALSVTPTPTVAPTPTAWQGAPVCPGDANGNGVVSIGEVQLAVKGFLGDCGGGRYVDNGDGTVTDLQTSLMWEKKTDGGIHSDALAFQWTSSGSAPDGGVFAGFLATLNGGATGVGNCVSADGATQSGGFAGHCDWRVPTVSELRTLLRVPCAASPCIDPVFGPTQLGYYWSSSVQQGFSSLVWLTDFTYGGTSGDYKNTFHYVRAVRGRDRSRGCIAALPATGWSGHRSEDRLDVGAEERRRRGARQGQSLWLEYRERPARWDRLHGFSGAVERWGDRGGELRERRCGDRERGFPGAL